MKLTSLFERFARMMSFSPNSNPPTHHLPLCTLYSTHYKMADSLVNAATSGQLTQKITDDGLKKMLESGVGADGTEINVQQKIKFQRRKFGGMDSSDDDNDDDLL